MKKKMIVTKAQVLKAIKTEPLMSGSFVFSGIKAKNKVGCAVCLVGGILEAKIGTKTNASEVAHVAAIMTSDACMLGKNSIQETKSRAKDLIGDKQYLSALSNLFEGIMERPGMADRHGFANSRARRIMTNFVKSNFPSRVTLERGKMY